MPHADRVRVNMGSQGYRRRLCVDAARLRFPPLMASLRPSTLVATLLRSAITSHDELSTWRISTIQSPEAAAPGVAPAPQVAPLAELVREAWMYDLSRSTTTPSELKRISTPIGDGASCPLLDHVQCGLP